MGDPLDKLVEQLILADVGLLAVPLEPAAAIIDVFLLLDISDELATAVAAGEQEVFLFTLVARMISSVEDRLHPFPKFEGY